MRTDSNVYPCIFPPIYISYIYSPFITCLSSLYFFLSFFPPFLYVIHYFCIHIHISITYFFQTILPYCHILLFFFFFPMHMYMYMSSSSHLFSNNSIDYSPDFLEMTSGVEGSEGKEKRTGELRTYLAGRQGAWAGSGRVVGGGWEVVGWTFCPGKAKPTCGLLPNIQPVTIMACVSVNPSATLINQTSLPFPSPHTHTSSLGRKGRRRRRKEKEEKGGRGRILIPPCLSLSLYMFLPLYFCLYLCRHFMLHCTFSLSLSLLSLLPSLLCLPHMTLQLPAPEPPLLLYLGEEEEKAGAVGDIPFYLPGTDLVQTPASLLSSSWNRKTQSVTAWPLWEVDILSSPHFPSCPSQGERERGLGHETSSLSIYSKWNVCPPTCLTLVFYFILHHEPAHPAGRKEGKRWRREQGMGVVLGTGYSFPIQTHSDPWHNTAQPPENLIPSDILVSHSSIIIGFHWNSILHLVTMTYIIIIINKSQEQAGQFIHWWMPI